MFHQIYVPKRPVHHGLVIDQAAERADKLLKHYRQQHVFTRRKLLFREFAARVDAGTWQPAQ